MSEADFPTLSYVVFRPRDDDLLGDLDDPAATSNSHADDDSGSCSSVDDNDDDGIVFGEPHEETAGEQQQRGGSASSCAGALGAETKEAIARSGAGSCSAAELYRRLMAVLRASTEKTLQANYASQQFEAGYYSWRGIGSLIATAATAATLSADRHCGGGGGRAPRPFASPDDALPPDALRGQRDPRTRLRVLAQHYDWGGKVIFDIGCNQGGMLLPLAHAASTAELGHRPIRHGVGVDGDAMLVNCATAMLRVMGCAPLASFYTWNLDDDDDDGGKERKEPTCGNGGGDGYGARSSSGGAKETRADGTVAAAAAATTNGAAAIHLRHKFLDNFLPTAGVDCIFLLSMCQWVRYLPAAHTDERMRHTCVDQGP